MAVDPSVRSTPEPPFVAMEASEVVVAELNERDDHIHLCEATVTALEVILFGDSQDRSRDALEARADALMSERDRAVREHCGVLGRGRRYG